MKIDNTHFVDVDAYQYILKKVQIAQSGKKEGEEVEVTLSYHGNLVQALKGYIDKMVKDEVEVSDDITTVINKIDNLKEHVSKLLNTDPLKK